MIHYPEPQYIRGDCCLILTPNIHKQLFENNKSYSSICEEISFIKYDCVGNIKVYYPKDENNPTELTKISIDGPKSIDINPSRLGNSSTFLEEYCNNFEIPDTILNLPLICKIKISNNYAKGEIKPNGLFIYAEPFGCYGNVKFKYKYKSILEKLKKYDELLQEFFKRKK